MRRAFKIFIVMALWAPAVVMVGAYANGISSDDFSGFDMGAKASAISFTFGSPSLGVPAKPNRDTNSLGGRRYMPRRKSSMACCPAARP